MSSDTRSRGPDLAGRSEAGAPRRADAATDRPLTRREREYLLHRREAARAAERLLAVKDYRDITVQDIATGAEFSVGYLYKLFANKQEIFAAIILHRQRQILDVVSEIVQSGGSARERLLRLIAGFFDWVQKNAAYSAGSLRSLQHLILANPELLHVTAAGRNEIEEQLTRLCAESIAEGTLAARSPRVIARTLRAVVTGFIKEEILDSELRGTERPALGSQQIAELVEQIVFRTFAPEAPNANVN